MKDKIDLEYFVPVTLSYKQEFVLEVNTELEVTIIYLRCPIRCFAVSENCRRAFTTMSLPDFHLSWFFSCPDYDYMTYHSGKTFSTFDRDNDDSRYSCAIGYHGGWWYSKCSRASLNGHYVSTMCLAAYRYHCQLQYVQMKIRPV